jgi:hypothetical protein
MLRVELQVRFEREYNFIEAHPDLRPTRPPDPARSDRAAITG